MKIVLLSVLLAVLGPAALVASEESQPVIPQREDGLIVLNPEAAAFVMTDKTGRHVMNATEPRLKIADGRIKNIGEGFQFPGWRFHVSAAGKFDVFMEVGTKTSEDSSLRLSFFKDGKEGRVVAPVPRGGNDEEPVFMGEIGLSEGEVEVVLMVSAADHPRRLPEIGTVVLVPVSAEAVQAFGDLLRKSRFAKTAETAELERTVRAASSELDGLKPKWNPKADWKKFQDYAEVLRWEQNGRRITELQAQIAQASKKLKDAQIAALQANKEQLPSEERSLLEAHWNRRVSWRDKVDDGSAMPVFAVKPVVAPALYPPGNLDRLKNGDVPSNGAVAGFDVPPPPDAAARRQAFAERNSPAGIERLSRRLHDALRPDVPGLEAYYAAFDAGRHADALDAYRDYFFRKLKCPEIYGAGGVSFVDDFFQSAGKALYLRPPQPEWLEDNLKGTGVLVLDGTVWKGLLGAPGTVNWAPEMLKPPEGIAYERGPDNNPFWKTAEGKLLNGQINFFRGLNRQPGQGGGSAMFPELLYSYCFTGNKDHLRLYADYWDDWAMNGVRDVENCPVNIRAATELQVVGWYRSLLRTILDERPEFAVDFPSASLARVMLTLTEIYHPYVIRAKRAEIANWGIMGVEGALNDSKLFQEFRSMDYSNRELSRLARINWIQHLSLDGENLESWDEGHVAIDGMLEGAPALILHGAPVMGDLEAGSLMDHAKTMQRTLLTHFSPDGNYWVPWLSEDDSARATIRGKIIPRAFVEDILDEPEARRRIMTSLGRVPDTGKLPTSDFQPYAQMAYLRDGFGEDRTSLVFQNFPFRSQNQGWTYNGKRGHLVGSMRTQYGVARDGRAVLEATPILVDSKPPNRFTDLTRTGGKTDFAFATPRHVQPGRFLASKEFDVIESMQDSPYRRFDFEYREMLGLKSTTPDEPIRDVRAFRQIIHLRGERVFVIGDRLEAPAIEREFSQIFLVPLRVGHPGELERLRLLSEANAPLVEIDREARSVRSLTPGLPNVSLFVAGHDFKWGGRSTGENTFESVASVTAADFYKQASQNKDPQRVIAEQRLKPVSIRWKGAGPQALAAAVFARPAEEESVGTSDLSERRDLSGGAGVAGLAFQTPQGTEVWYQIAPSGRVALQAGPAAATAGSLLATRKDGRLAGVVMDGDAVVLNGKSYPGPASSFAFELEADGKFQAQQVGVPIDTVVIEPQQTVFTDSVKVSFGIPTQNRNDLEFRYTLDGSDPTLESTRYEAPFEIRADTRVKVRAFRKGLKETPWNIAGTDASKTVSAIYRKVTPHPATSVPGELQAGLNYEYFEDSWLRLFSHSGMNPYLPAKAAGVADNLLDPAQLETILRTDRAFAVKYDGFIDVPASGVYRFFAPEPLYNTTLDAGYDLRVWIDGEEWFPNPDLHAENIWSVALEKGLHRFQVSYVDYRWKKFRNEYWMSWNPDQMWQGTPTLEMTGPGIPKQPVPSAWLKREKR